MEAGPLAGGGMSPAAISWIELGAWERGTGITLQPWEGRLVRALSTAFLAESQRATEHDAVPPWEFSETFHKDQATAVSASMRESMRALANL